MSGAAAGGQYELVRETQHPAHVRSSPLPRSRSASPARVLHDVESRGGIKDKLESQRLLDGSPPTSPTLNKRSKSSHEAMFSMICYCASSSGMILLNKFMLSRWDAHVTLMFYQNLIAVAVLGLLAWSRRVDLDPLNWAVVRVWLPVNFIFVGMLVTSFFSLQYIGVPMVTILKNMTNLLTAVGEMYLFRTRHRLMVWCALLLMVLSALCGGVTDLQFHPYGYLWQLLNCFFTAGYSLVLRRSMDVAKMATDTGNLSETTMVLLNTSLSLPLGFFLIFSFGEHKYLMSTPLIYSPKFVGLATFSGLVGLSISFTSMWFLHCTSPTTYSLVGSLNKIPLSILGMLLFKAPMLITNKVSIMVGLLAGVVFAVAKMSV